MKEFTIGQNDAGQRLDRFLAKAVPLLPASLAQKYIRIKRIKCNGKRIDRDTRLQEGDVLQLYINDEFFDKPREDNAYLTVANPNLNIVYEDENILLVDKRPGLAVHPHDGAEYGRTLIDHIQSYLYQKREWRPREENAFTPALCNRIDRNTGGIVIAAKTAEALRVMNQKIKDREIDKRYLAIVEGTKLIAREVSDGVIAPGYTDEALAILKTKRKGGYNVVAIDPDYVPAEQETKQVFGITFQQGRNNFKIDGHLLRNIVTKNKDLPESAKIDLIVALITLKYTQSNSVCFAYDGQAVGVGAGQQSRIHCTRLAGSKADTFFLRQHPKTLSLPFRADLGRPNRDNVIDGYINGNEEDVCADGIWQNYFTRQPDRLTEEDKREFLSKFDGVSLGSDAFFPFPDNIKRAKASGVKYIAQPGGSIRDDLVIEECDKDGMVMAFTGMRLFHH